MSDDNDGTAGLAGLVSWIMTTTLLSTDAVSYTHLAGRQKIRGRITPGGRDGKSSIYRERNYDRKVRHQSGGGR